MTGEKKRSTLIGRGVFSKVYAVSINMCKKVCVEGHDAKEEMDAMISIKHPNVIEMMDHRFDSLNRYVFLFKRYTCDLSEMEFYDLDLKLDYTKQILSGVCAIHKAGWFHRDISVHNILIDTFKQQLVISDFGWAGKFYPGKPNTMPPCAVYVRPPEVLFEENRFYTEKVDIWATGCVIYFIYANRHLFENMESTEDIMVDQKNFLDGGYPTPSTMTCSQYKVWEKMMRRNPKKRISAEKALAHFQ